MVGVAPVLQLGGGNTAAALRAGTGAPHVSWRLLDSREVPTVVQVALAMLLAVGAGLFARTLQNLKSVDMGFDRDNILLVRSIPPGAGIPAREPRSSSISCSSAPVPGRRSKPRGWRVTAP